MAVLSTRSAHIDPKIFDAISSVTLVRDRLIFATNLLLAHHKMANDLVLRAILEDIGDELEIAAIASFDSVTICEGLV